MLKVAVPDYGGYADYPSTLWLRYRGGNFVPTNPPGRGPACSSRAIDAARPWVVRSEAEALGVGPVGKPFKARRFVCRDGWALARGAGGRQSIALYVQAGIRWQRAAEASPRNFVSRVGVLAPTPLMRWHMARAVGLELRRPRKPHGPRTDMPSSDVAPLSRLGAVRIPVIPGAVVYGGQLGFGYNSRPLVGRLCARCWFLVATEGSPGGTRSSATLHIFRWHRDRWAVNGTVTQAITSPARDPSAYPTVQGFQRSRGPSFTLSTADDPGWLVDVARVSGRWRVVPFIDRYGVARESQSTSFSPSHATGYPRPHVQAWYRFGGGTFHAYRYRPDPQCDAALMSPLLKHRITRTKAACGYGWALLKGRQQGREVVAEYDISGGSWSWDSTLPLRYTRYGDDPGWLDNLLLKQLLR